MTVTNKPGKGANAGKVYTNVSAVSTMRAKQADAAPPLVNEGSVFLCDEPDLEIFNNIPEWIQKKITQDNLEYGGSPLEALLGGTAAPTTPPEEPAPEVEPADTTEAADPGVDW